MKRLLLLFLSALALVLGLALARDPGVVGRASIQVEAPAPAPLEAGQIELRTLAPGIEYGRYRLPVPAALGDSLLRFVRVDPALADLELRAAGLGDKVIRTASAWGAIDADHAAVAVINSSMFQDDWLTSVGYLRLRGKVSNPRWAGEQKALLALDPLLPTARPTVANLGCEDRQAVLDRYATLVQSIRMVGCKGENLWADGPRAWSSAIIGLDHSGRLLFLHVRSPYTMHALVDLLLAAPLEIEGLLYGEGGPEASLYVRGPDFEEVNVGSFETGFREDDGNRQEWQLPNVVVARSR